MKCLLLGRSTLWITPWISCHWCDIPSDGKDIFRPRWNYMGKQFSKRKFGARDAAALSLLADNFLPDTQWTFTAGLLTLSPAARVRIWLLVVGCEMGAWLRLAYCWLGWSHNNRVCWTQLEHFPNGNLVAFCIISICRLFPGRRLHTSRSRCVCVVARVLLVEFEPRFHHFSGLKILLCTIFYLHQNIFMLQNSVYLSFLNPSPFNLSFYICVFHTNP